MKMLANGLLGKAMWVLVGVMVLGLVEGHAVGQCELVKLLVSDGAADDHFGTSVSITGTSGNEVAIVGAFDADNGLFSGAAYIYRKIGASWVQEAKLLASDGAAGDFFGGSVSIRGTPGNEVVIVGANEDDDNGTNSGSAYIYHFNGANWVEEQKLLASDGAAGDHFGFSVSIIVNSGNEVAIVGAPFDDDNGSYSGVAYIYRFNGLIWVEEQKITASDGAARDFFGWSVSISGSPANEVAIVGAWGDDSPLLDSGSAYIYRFNGVNWDEEQKLLTSDGSAGGAFGISVSISDTPGNEVAIVGAYKDDNDNGIDSGSAYIYRFNGVNWVEEQKLLASDGAEGDRLGQSVSISGDPGNEIAIVGAYVDDDNGFSSGSAYTYSFNGVSWVAEAKLLASDGAAGDLFGWSVSISGASGNEVAIVGARTDSDNGNDSGSAYIFELTACPADTNCSGDVNVTDLLMLLGAWGPCPPPCPSDTNGDGAVNVTDLLALLAAWGACP